MPLYNFDAVIRTTNVDRRSCVVKVDGNNLPIEAKRRDMMINNKMFLITIDLIARPAI